MEFRSVKERDLPELYEFVKKVYKEEPLAMWFEKEPTLEEFMNIFTLKIRGTERKELIDIVAIKDSEIVGECEITRKEHGEGVIGIILIKKITGKGEGLKLLNFSIRESEKVRIKSFEAEVIKENEPACKFFKKAGFRIVDGRSRRIEIRGSEHKTLLFRKDGPPAQ